MHDLSRITTSAFLILAFVVAAPWAQPTGEAATAEALAPIDLEQPGLGISHSVESRADWEKELADLRTNSPASMEGKQRMLLCLRRLDRHEELLKVADSWAMAEPDEPLWQAWRALAFMRMGRPRDAAAAVDQAEGARDRPAYALAAGLFLAQAGAQADAQLLLTQAGLNPLFTGESLLWLIGIYRDGATRRQEANSTKQWNLNFTSDAWPAPIGRRTGVSASLDSPRSMLRPMMGLQLPEGFEYGRFAWTLQEVVPTTDDLLAPEESFDPYPAELAARLGSYGPQAKVPMVEVMLTDNAGAARSHIFLLDTLGPEVIVVDAASVEKLAWSADEIPSLEAGSWGTLPTLRIGQLEFTEGVAVARTLGWQLTDGRPVTGVLSVEVFKPWSVMLDLVKSQVLLEKEHLFYDVEREGHLLRLNGTWAGLAGAGLTGDASSLELLYVIDSLANGAYIAPSLMVADAGEAMGVRMIETLVTLKPTPWPWLERELSPRLGARVGLLVGLGALAEGFETVTICQPLLSLVARPVGAVSPPPAAAQPPEASPTP